MESVVSVVIPCRNEERYIRPCLESVLGFDRPAGVEMEILVLDGGSTDRTRTIVSEIAAIDPRVRCLDNPAIIQACALNLAIREARGRWVMRLDAHARYPSDYLVQCHATALRTGAANVGGLCRTQPGGETYQAQLVQALTTHKFGVGDSGFRTGAAEGRRDTVPFGFFSRTIFADIGLFDERLVRAQDYEFNRRIAASGRVVWLNPAIVSFYHNQPTLRAFYRKQFVQEAPYNAYLWYLAPYAFASRHAVTGIFSAGVLGGLAFGLLTPWIALPFSLAMTAYGLMAVASALQQAVHYRRLRHAFCLPFCFFLFHFIHGLGLLGGLGRLLLRIAPVQKGAEPWRGAGRFRAWPIPAAAPAV